MKAFISRSQFAHELGVSLSTVSRGSRRGIYPFSMSVKIGRRVLYPSSLLEELQELAVKEKPKTQLPQGESK
jgi:hypothetical protein